METQPTTHLQAPVDSVWNKYLPKNRHVGGREGEREGGQKTSKQTTSKQWKRKAHGINPGTPTYR